jgi:hypothetical protein
MDDCKERRGAEIEFVESAYGNEEAWCERDSNTLRVVRRLTLTSSTNDNNSWRCVSICLKLTLPEDYPTQSSLQIDSTIDDENGKTNSPTLLKLALNALPHLVASCRQIAEENQGEESVFLVFNQAEEWIQDEWPTFQLQQRQASEKLSVPSTTTATTTTTNEDRNNKTLSSSFVLGRRLIYSHHIISKIKRADIKSLALYFKLTGYMKIGWPGLLIIEGLEEDCMSFSDEIRPWNWQYLVVRGEQQENITSGDLDTHRKFNNFLEVEDMSLVAKHCKSVGLEALFRTSMKVYDHSSTNEQQGEHFSYSNSENCYYGAMVHVDHMNNPKGYRKWIRKTSQETDCRVLIKQSYKNQDYSERPKIIVGIVGENRDHVAGYLKRWRTSRVDVDARGKPCYERQMTVAVEGSITIENEVDWDSAASEDNVTMPEERLVEILQTIGNIDWREAFEKILGI